MQRARRLLLIFAYVRLFDPFGSALPINLENLKRGSDIYLMSVHLHLHKVTHCNERFRIPVEFERISRGYEHSSAAILGTIARTIITFVGNDSPSETTNLMDVSFKTLLSLPKTVIPSSEP